VKLTSGLLERRADAAVTFPEAGAGTVVTPASGDMQWLPLAAVVSAVLVGAAAAWLIRRNAELSARMPDDLAGQDARC
jgi:hypothetical protein